MSKPNEMDVIQKEIEEDARQFILDNVICSGVTATAAIRAFKSKGIDAKVLALTRATWRS